MLNTLPVKKFIALVCFGFVGLLFGCAPATKIVTNRANDYAGNPKRVFVITNVGSEFGEKFLSAFRIKMISVARDCGAELELTAPTALELDDSVHVTRMKNFNPDSVLNIGRAGGTRAAYGEILHVVYDVRLSDVASKKLVWRANVNFFRGPPHIPVASRGEALAIDITNKMKEDKIFSGCPLIEVDRSKSSPDEGQRP